MHNKLKTNTTIQNWAIGNSRGILRKIHQKETNIVIYERNTDALFKEINHLLDANIEFRSSGDPDSLRKALDTDKSLKLCTLIKDDILRFLQQFKDISGSKSFRLLFAVISTNMCTKLHSDINDLRMLCTYAGSGTIWVPDAAIDEKANHPKSNSKEIIIDESLLRQAKPGDVVILKGALYPDADPILHRSPSIEESNQKRLLLRIDTNATSNLWT